MPESGTTYPALVGIDWGTTSLRAYLIGAGGDVLEGVQSLSGILNVPDGDFAFIMEQACGTWLKQWPGLPVLMCGMIGSRQGWREAPYVHGGANASDLAAALTRVFTGRYEAHIVPGLEARSFSGDPDVMRGEETMLIGALALGGPANGLFCLPGTHSKWISVSGGRSDAFSTYLTGEIFDLLCRWSVLSALIRDSGPATQSERSGAFRRGLDLARAAPDLLHQLFSIRARALTQVQGEHAAADVLSGLLIGSELTSMDRRLRDCEEPPILIASGAIADRYREALVHFGYAPSVLDAETACARGLHAIAAHSPSTVSVDAANAN